QGDADSGICRLPAWLRRRAVVPRCPRHRDLSRNVRGAAADHRGRDSGADITLHEGRRVMKPYVLILAMLSSVACGQAVTARAENSEIWAREAQNVTIIRDHWGIPHVFGKTDADAVFGVIYAQAEDDFNRVETNYLNALGRLAEAEGEGEIYRDLRMKLFIDPDHLRAHYNKSPDCFK